MDRLNEPKKQPSKPETRPDSRKKARREWGCGGVRAGGGGKG